MRPFVENTSTQSPDSFYKLDNNYFYFQRLQLQKVNCLVALEMPVNAG